MSQQPASHRGAYGRLLEKVKARYEAEGFTVSLDEPLPRSRGRPHRGLQDRSFLCPGLIFAGLTRGLKPEPRGATGCQPKLSVAPAAPVGGSGGGAVDGGGGALGGY